MKGSLVMTGFRWFASIASLCLIGAGNIVGQTLPVDGEMVSVTTVTLDRTSTASGASVYRDTGLSSSDVITTASHTTGSSPVEFDPATMMEVDDVRPGMKGYGLTVFSGLRPERFEAEVVAVRHGMMAGTDIIMARLTSPHLVDIGVIAGMSGSPVYMDDKLIGAVAYGFLNVDDPLAGITPIKDMLTVYNSTPVIPATQPDDSADAGGFAPFDAYMALKQEPTMENLRKVAMLDQPWKLLSMRMSDFNSVASDLNLPGELKLEPLAAPVVLSAQNTLTSQYASSLFGGLEVLEAGNELTQMSTQGASGLALNSPGGPVEDLPAFTNEIAGGYAISVPFIEGDLNMAAVGTVTWRLNDRLVAFGHPMFQHGTVYAPMAAARVNALIRSRERPFKLGESVGHVGMVRQDRQPAIGGLFGQTAAMFPISTTVRDPIFEGERQFNFNVWNDRRMTPGLIMTALVESLGSAARTGGESAALYKYAIQLDDGTSISAENYNSDASGTIMAVFGAMADAGMLLNNPYKRVNLAGLEFEMTVSDRLRQAALEAATLDKTAYAPGETATVEWVLRPYREDPVRMSYEFLVPDVLPDGDYEIVVGDAGTRQSLESRRHPGGQKIHSFDDLVRVIQQNYAENRIYVALVDKDTGVAVQGSEMPKLPGSVINLIQGTVNSEYFSPVRGNFVVDADLVTDYEVSGQATVKLKVERSVGN